MDARSRWSSFLPVAGAPRVLAMYAALAFLAPFRMPAAEPASAPAEEELDPDLGSLLEAGRAWWDENAPAELRESLAFPDPAQVQDFLARLETALEEGSFEELAAYEPEARGALAVLRSSDAGAPWADWLEPRLDLLVAAARLTGNGPVEPASGRGKAATPARPVPPRGKQPLSEPSFTAPPQPPARALLDRAYWEKVVVGRRPPAAAGRFVPRLKQIFAQSGVAPEWVWLAEVESSMNPAATSPAGARGLFQFMPATAERFGLRTQSPDERTDPEKSARAAASYLRLLHGRFGDWPLALAAYNAGEGRVGRLLAAGKGTSFESIAPRLPAETRLYVPKVLATVAVRESVDPLRLPPPVASTSSAERGRAPAGAAPGKETRNPARRP